MKKICEGTQAMPQARGTALLKYLKRRDEEQIRTTKMLHMKSQTEKNYSRRIALEWSVGTLLGSYLKVKGIISFGLR